MCSLLYTFDSFLTISSFYLDDFYKNLCFEEELFEYSLNMNFLSWGVHSKKYSKKKISKKLHLQRWEKKLLKCHVYLQFSGKNCTYKCHSFWKRLITDLLTIMTEEGKKHHHHPFHNNDGQKCGSGHFRLLYVALHNNGVI